MILGTRHTGLVVRNLDKSLEFYHDLLGFKIVKRMTESGDYIDKIVGIPDAVIEWVKLELPDRSLVELLEYKSGLEDTETDPQYPSNKHGCSHIAFTVDNISGLNDLLTQNGYVCKHEPLNSPDGKVKVMYCHDPDGIILEMVEERS